MSKNLRFVVSSTNLLILNSYITFVSRVLCVQKKIYLPNKIKKLTVLRSPHVNKKSREQFEIRYFKCLIIFSKITPDFFFKLRFLIFKYSPANLWIKLTYL